MTWAILIRSNDPVQVELYGTLGVRTLCYILPSLGFLAFDSMSPSLSVNMKEHGKPALPMSEDQGGPKGPWWRITLVSIGNVLLSVALQIGLELLVTRVLHLRSLLQLSTSLPFPWSIAKDICLGLILREVITYTLHRYVLHAEHSTFADLHKSWQHSIYPPFSLVAHYDHPVTYIVHVFLPMYLPAALFRFHFLTYEIFLILISLEEVFSYSGYNVLPSAFILGGMARRQEKHLMGDLDGNYGCLGLADLLMGTSLGTDVVDDMIDEAEDRESKGKARGKSSTMARKVHKGAPKSSRNGKDTDKATLTEDGETEFSSSGRKNERKEDKGEKERVVKESDEGVGSPVRRSRRNGKKTRDHEDSTEEEHKLEARPSTRKGGQKSKGGGRTQRRGEDNE